MTGTITENHPLPNSGRKLLCDKPLRNQLVSYGQDASLNSKFSAAMNHPISLKITLVEQSQSLLKLQLGIENCAAFPIFMPEPGITRIRFEHIIGKRQAEWFTSLLVSSEASGIVLQPLQVRSFEFLVRPMQIEPPRTDALDDYSRFCIDIPPGEYLAYYELEIGADYFDPDSHAELRDLERMALEEKSEVWLGRVESNRIKVVYTNG